MNLSQKIARLTLLILLVVALPVAVMAKTTANQAPAEPDPNANPVLASIIKLGAQLYYIGNHAGMDGWFIVKNGQVQIAYATPDGQNALIGAMFGPDGEDITSAQVEPLLEAHPKIKALLTVPAVRPEPSPFVKPTTIYGLPIPGSSSAASTIMNMATTPPSLTPGVASVPPTSVPTSSPTATPAAATVLPSDERLYRDLLTTSGVTLGSSGPQMLMVMDPDCSHCQATWRALRDSVMKGTVQIRMIPIAAEGSDNERAAAKFIHVADPLGAWDKYVGGDKKQLAGAAAPDMIAAVQANHKMTDSWNIEATPFMVYRGKDGKVKTHQGEPEKITSILSDLAP